MSLRFASQSGTIVKFFIMARTTPIPFVWNFSSANRYYFGTPLFWHYHFLSICAAINYKRTGKTLKTRRASLLAPLLPTLPTKLVTVSRSFIALQVIQDFRQPVFQPTTRGDPAAHRPDTKPPQSTRCSIAKLPRDL
jgi:hypothetical protein